MNEGVCLSTLYGHTHSVTCLKLFDGGQRPMLLSASGDRTVRYFFTSILEVFAIQLAFTGFGMWRPSAACGFSREARTGSGHWKGWAMDATSSLALSEFDCYLICAFFFWIIHNLTSVPLNY